jgi:hypothetical protein
MSPAKKKVTKKVVKKSVKKVTKKKVVKKKAAKKTAAAKKTTTGASPVKKKTEIPVAKSNAAKKQAKKSATKKIAKKTVKKVIKKITKKKLSGPKAATTKANNATSSFDDDFLVLMQRDPNWLHAFWNVSERRRRLALQEGRKMVLRLYDVSRDKTVRQRRKPVQEIEVPVSARSWYISRETKGDVKVEIGTISPRGKFEPVVESAEVHDEADFQQAYDAWQEGMDVFVRESLGGTEWTALGSSAMIMKQILGEISGQAPWPGSAAPSSEAFSSRMLQDTSGKTMLSEKGKDFFLWVKTRLIVYGGTAPDASLQVQGKPFPLRPDGTFSFEVDLPDSHQEFPIRAVDKDGDQERQITPIVDKRTE